MHRTGGNTSYGWGSTYGGSSLRATGIHQRSNANGIGFLRSSINAGSGTWRSMGQVNNLDANWTVATVLVRIS